MKKIIIVTLLVIVIGIGFIIRSHVVTPIGVESVRVVRIIDGDTIELDSGEKVRFLGIDTPERGQCGYQEAKKNLQRLILDERVILVSDGQTTDKYGRLLRYVELGHRDIGLEQIKEGWAVARYDSNDGYPKHSRQTNYHKIDDQVRNKCP